MTRPAKPTPVHEGVVEMDAMDVHEWDAGQRTPQASDANLAALVKQSTSAPAAVERAVAARPQFARTTQSSPRQPGATGTPRIQAAPGRAGAAPPAPTRSSAPPSAPRSRRPLPDEREDLAPRAPPPALTFDTAPQPHVVFDDPAERTKVHPASLAPPQRTPLATPADARLGAADEVAPGPAPPAARGAAPIQSPFPSGRYEAAPIQSPSPSVHEAAPLRYPVAVREVTAPPRPEPERRAEPEPEPRVAPSRRKLWWIGGAIGAATIGIVVAVISSGGSAPVAEPAPVAAVAPRAAPVAPAPAPVHAAAPPATPPPAKPTPAAPASPPLEAAAAHSTPAAEHPTSAVAQVTPAAEPPAPTAPTATGASRPTRVALATQRPGRPARRPATKSSRVVIEYAAHPGAPETPGLVAQAAEDPAIGRARGAYIAGNEKLFAGDTAGAIESYRESLGLYPGYVGGYRGLGLAYAQRGDHAKALEAFRTYVTAAPSARDVPLIKKRIARLQHDGGRLPL